MVEQEALAAAEDQAARAAAEEQAVHVAADERAARAFAQVVRAAEVAACVASKRDKAARARYTGTTERGRRVFGDAVAGTAGRTVYVGT